MTMFKSMTIRRVLAQPLHVRPTPITITRSVRSFSQNARQLAAKDAQDKDSLKPEPNEYTKSGSDDEAAVSDTAFDPSQTSPEQEHDSVKKDADDVCLIPPSLAHIQKDD